MNHLAHALLAGNDDGLRLGGMLGDFVHGQPDPARFPARVIDGIRLHRAIDVYTDAHPEVQAAKALFQPPYRRYAGILLDVLFDHYLARDFSHWSTQSLAAFSDELRQLLHREDGLLPVELRRFRGYMDAHGLPAGYAQEAEMERALHGIGQRFGHANPLAQAWPLLKAREKPLLERFSRFFPDLQAFARTWIEMHHPA